MVTPETDESCKLEMLREPGTSDDNLAEMVRVLREEIRS
jgi:hypothetical protein